MALGLGEHKCGKNLPLGNGRSYAQKNDRRGKVAVGTKGKEMGQVYNKCFYSLVRQLRNKKISRGLFVIEWKAAQQRADAHCKKGGEHE